MSSPARDFAYFFQENGLGVVGSDIFRTTQPPLPEEAITVIDAPAWGNASPQIEEDYPSIKILVRGGTDDANYARAESIKNLLVGMSARDINGRRIVGIWMVGDINWIGRDESNRPQRSLNFNIMRARFDTPIAPVWATLLNAPFSPATDPGLPDPDGAFVWDYFPAFGGSSTDWKTVEESGVFLARATTEPARAAIDYGQPLDGKRIVATVGALGVLGPTLYCGLNPNVGPPPTGRAVNVEPNGVVHIDEVGVGILVSSSEGVANVGDSIEVYLSATDGIRVEVNGLPIGLSHPDGSFVDADHSFVGMELQEVGSAWADGLKVEELTA